MTELAPIVVVAGATGYIGRHVVQELHERGWRVRALARDERKLAPVRDACDEVFVGEATNPDTLTGLCDGAYAVISSLGLRTLRRRPGPEDVDLRANRNVLEQARRSGVRRFVFVSVLHGDQMARSVPILRPRERFTAELRASELSWTVLRATGSFNDMLELFGFARKGWRLLVGSGESPINPIHPADIAAEAVRTLTDESSRNVERGIGGPQVWTQRQAYRLAAQILDRRLRTVRVPVGSIRAMAWMVEPFNRNAAGFARFFCEVLTRDMVGEKVGDHLLETCYRQRAGADSPP